MWVKEACILRRHASCSDRALQECPLTQSLTSLSSLSDSFDIPFN